MIFTDQFFNYIELHTNDTYLKAVNFYVHIDELIWILKLIVVEFVLNWWSSVAIGSNDENFWSFANNL